MLKSPARIASPAAVAALLLGGLGAGAHAQVGHPPEASPYRFLDSRYAVTLAGGYALGSGGRVGVGPSSGALGGLQLDLHLAGPGRAAFGILRGRLERRLLDPDEAPENRDLGTTTQSILFADAGVDLVLTGEKTWNGLAPYLGASLGIALGADVPADSSGFTFSSKFIVGPRIGVRWHPARRLAIRFEARDLIWQLRYPATFFIEPVNAPGTDPILDELTTRASEWTHNPMLTVSVGYVFR